MEQMTLLYFNDQHDPNKGEKEPRQVRAGLDSILLLLSRVHVAAGVQGNPERFLALYIHFCNGMDEATLKQFLGMLSDEQTSKCANALGSRVSLIKRG